MVKNYYNAKQYKPFKSLSYLTRRASKLMTAQMESLFSTLDMSFVQYAVLMHVREGMTITASEICQNILHDTGALTRIIDQMETRGFLTRKRSKTDRRRVELKLTAKGDDILNKLVTLIVGFWDEVLADFTREEADLMTNMMMRMTDKLTNMQQQQKAA